MRLNVYISSSGLCSRRRAEHYIRDGHVMINGVVEHGLPSVCAADVVTVEGMVVVPKEEMTYLLLHKPRGIVCTASRERAENVIDFVNYPERIFPVGRLDNQSEGLLLLTDDGTLTHHLLRRESDVEKEYRVTVNRDITADLIAGLSRGVSIYNPRTKGHTMTDPCTVVQTGEREFHITLTQGLNRQIRRMCRRYQYTVTRLKRIRLKDLTLGDLPVGEWRYVTEEEVKSLKED